METQTMVHDKEKIFGMDPYVAPELFNTPSFSKITDIYSLGVLLWVLSSGYSPFKGYDISALIHNIANGNREKMIPGTPSDYHKLYNCWNGNPEERPIIEDVYRKLQCMLPNKIIATIEDNKAETE